MDRMKQKERFRRKRVDFKLKLKGDENDEEVSVKKFTPSSTDLDFENDQDIDLDFDDVSENQEIDIDIEEKEENSCGSGCELSKGINQKLGFSGWMCRAGDKTCKRNNIILIVATFFITLLIGYSILKYSRPKIILDKKGHVVQKKLVLYSFLFGLIGPVLYLSYILITA